MFTDEPDSVSTPLQALGRAGNMAVIQYPAQLELIRIMSPLATVIFTQ